MCRCPAGDAKFAVIAAPRPATGPARSNTTAEILIDSPGRFLYVSNRGHGSIAVYAIDRAGRLTLVEHAASGGRTPRNFSLDPTGKYLFSSNQDTENVVVLQPRLSNLASPAGGVPTTRR